MTLSWNNLSSLILQLEREGVVTRTFRRLDPKRQQAVIDAILIEAAEKGAAALNIKDVAQRAGVAVGSLYQYFPRRDGLLEFAVRLFSTNLLKLFEEGRSYLVQMPLQQALEAYLTYGVEWGQNEYNLVRFFGRAAYQGDAMLQERLVRPVAEVMRLTVVEILQAAAERGELKPGLDIEATARAVNALMIAIGDSQLFPHLNIYFQLLDDCDMTPGRLTSAALALVMQGIAASPSQENEALNG